MTTVALTPGDGDPRHGTDNGYINCRCRCELCRAAHVAEALRARERRKRRLDADPSIAPHGVETTYFNYRCRCAHCSEAHRAAELIRRAKRLIREADSA